MRLRPPDRLGQSTVEFALVAPLIAASAALVLLVLAIGLETLSLDDMARRGARIAAASDDPRHAARAIVPDDVQVAIIIDENVGTITVQLSRPWTASVPFVGRWLHWPALTASATTVIEPPLVTG